MPEYNIDFFAWTQEQSALIRVRRWSEIDVEHLADEIKDMGKMRKEPWKVVRKYC